MTHTSFEAKDRGRPVLLQHNKSDACQTVVPKGFCQAYHRLKNVHHCTNVMHVDSPILLFCCWRGQPGASGRLSQTAGNKVAHMGGKSSGQHSTASCLDFI